MTTQRYIFSGGLSRAMVDYLKRVPEFEPIDVLVTQLDRGSIQDMLKYKEEGVVKSLFIDSGAFSFHTGKCKHLDVEEYAEFCNSIDEHVYAIAQVDTIPGKFGQPKSQQDYEESCDGSWKNYLYMRKLLKSPEKLIPVFHMNEPIRALRRMLDFRDPTVKDTTPKHSDILGKVYPDRVNILGLSPSNDQHTNEKANFLFQCYDEIKKSSYPDVKTHLFGMTSMELLSKLPYYSADSVSHRLRTGYNKVYTREWGTISLSDKARTVKSKSNRSFIRTCDPATLKKVTDLFAHYGFTIDDMINDNAARVCVDICEVQKAMKELYFYQPHKVKRPKKLF